MRRLLATLFIVVIGCATPKLTIGPPPYRALGQLVIYEHNIALRGHMAATWRGGMPIIYWHPDRVPELTEVMSRFVLAHEYCHLVYEGGSEIRADCCGLALLHGSGVGDELALAEIVEAVSDWPGSPAHPPGTFRALGLMACSISLGM